VALVFVTTTFTAPTPCAGVRAVMVVLFTTTTLVAADPPKVTDAPVRKPVPVRVTGVPPEARPKAGLTCVRVTGAETVVTVTVALPLFEHPACDVTVTVKPREPGEPAVKLTALPVVAPLKVPLVMPQTYVAPTPALGTDALPGAPDPMVAAVVMVALGMGLTATVVVAEALLGQPLVVTVTV
jgi:hypothetical protein